MVNIAISLHLSGAVNHVSLAVSSGIHQTRGWGELTHTHLRLERLLETLSHACTPARPHTNIIEHQESSSQSHKHVCTPEGWHILYRHVEWFTHNMNYIWTTCDQSVSTYHASYFLLYFQDSKTWLLLALKVSLAHSFIRFLIFHLHYPHCWRYINKSCSSAFIGAISTFNAGTKASGEIPVGKARKTGIKWRKMPCSVYFLQPLLYSLLEQQTCISCILSECKCDHKKISFGICLWRSYALF